MNIKDVFSEVRSSKINRPYIIAEAGVNHEGDMGLAERIICEAKEGGADAVKFQTYKAETLASKNSPSYWDLSKESTRSQFDLFKKYDSFWKGEYEKLKTICDREGIEFMSTPFDVESADFLNDLMPVFKISSSDITNKPFIEYMARFNKPIILSTGAATLEEIKEAVSWITPFGNDLALLHCVLNYPTLNENANLGMIKGLADQFPDNVIGYSDHTLPGDMQVMEIATLLGARIIEKHFTHDKSLPGNDHYHSMDFRDLQLFNSKFEEVETLLGKFEVDVLSSEDKSIRNARRSLVSKVAIPEGTHITKNHLTWKRPGTGISPKFIEEVIGRVAKVDMPEDHILGWNDLKEE